MENKKPSSRRSFLKGVAASPVLLAAPAPASAAPPSAPRANIGPSTTTEPYLLPSITGAKTRSILTVGDSVEGYRMVGIPDGLGAFRSGHREFTLLMNHEITAGAPGDRARARQQRRVRLALDHRRRDAAASTKGQDLTPSPAKVFRGIHRPAKYVAGTTQWQRFCSADLPDEGAFFAQRPGHARAHLHGRRGSHRGPRLGAGGHRPPRRRGLAAAAHGPDGLRERRGLSLSPGEDDRGPAPTTATSAPRPRAIPAARCTSTSAARPGTAIRSSRPVSPTARSSA